MAKEKVLNKTGVEILKDEVGKMIPTSLPANGGNAATVNNYTVNANVPSGAKFTDTTYSAATSSVQGLMSAADKRKLDGIAEGANAYGVVNATATLSTSGWSSKSQTVTVSGVTASNTVIISPDAANQSEYIDCTVICTSQGSNTLTFTCETVPATALKVNIAIFS